MIAYVETRLVLEGVGYENAKYVPSGEDTVIGAGAVWVRKAVFEGDPPKEIILTVTPA